MTPDKKVLRVIEYARLWGVEVDVKEMSTPDLLGPGGYGLNGWGTKNPKIVRQKSLESNELTWPHLMHELSHATWPVHPHNVVDELEETLGFEVLSLRFLRLPMSEWDDWMGSYMIDSGTHKEWRNASQSYKKDVIRHAQLITKEAGFFVGRKPSFQRPILWTIQRAMEKLSSRV